MEASQKGKSRGQMGRMAALQLALVDVLKREKVERSKQGHLQELSDNYRAMVAEQETDQARWLYIAQHLLLKARADGHAMEANSLAGQARTISTQLSLLEAAANADVLLPVPSNWAVQCAGADDTAGIEVAA